MVTEMFKKDKCLVHHMQTAALSQRDFQYNKQQNLVRMLSELKQNMPSTKYQSEPYQGKTPFIPGTLKDYKELELHFAKMGAYGVGAYMTSVIAASNDPNLAIYLPDLSVETKSLELAEQKRDQSGFVQQIAPQLNGGNGNAPLNLKKYGANPYSYFRKSTYPAVYLKSFSKGIYGGIDKKVREAFGKIRNVYQSRSGVFRDKKIYIGKDTPLAKDNVMSLDNYRVAVNQKRYTITMPSQDLEERVA